MKMFYFKSFLFWFVLLIAALVNATIRELTYKPLLTPIIGIWAHQISSLTAIIFFFVLIYLFLKYCRYSYSRKDLLLIGLLWATMTILFECYMNISIRKLPLNKVIETYYFWKGDMWVFVLASLIIIPQVVKKLLKR